MNIPESKTFVDSSSYYGTLFHELIHSSGHASRLYRTELMENGSFGSRLYSIEELTAEMGACYLKSYAGIPIENLENNAAYIQHWLGKLKDDKKYIVHASAEAQRATDFILNIRNVEKEIELSQNHSEGRERGLKKVRNKENNRMIER